MFGQKGKPKVHQSIKGVFGDDDDDDEPQQNIQQKSVKNSGVNIVPAVTHGIQRTQESMIKTLNQLQGIDNDSKRPNTSKSSMDKINDANIDTTTNIFIQSLSPQCTEDILTSVFENALQISKRTKKSQEIRNPSIQYKSPLMSVKIMWPRVEDDEVRRRSNPGFVSFADRESADNVRDRLEGSMFMNFGIVMSQTKPLEQSKMRSPRVIQRLCIPQPNQWNNFNQKTNAPKLESTYALLNQRIIIRPDSNQVSLPKQFSHQNIQQTSSLFKEMKEFSSRIIFNGNIDLNPIGGSKQSFYLNPNSYQKIYSVPQNIRNLLFYSPGENIEDLVVYPVLYRNTDQSSLLQLEKELREIQTNHQHQFQEQQQFFQQQQQHMYQQQQQQRQQQPQAQLQQQQLQQQLLLIQQQIQSLQQKQYQTQNITEKQQQQSQIQQFQQQQLVLQQQLQVNQQQQNQQMQTQQMILDQNVQQAHLQKQFDEKEMIIYQKILDLKKETLYSLEMPQIILIKEPLGIEDIMKEYISIIT